MQTQTEKLMRKILKKLAPPPNITLSQWADRYRYLSPESAAEPGRWKTSRAPYQKEPMDAITDVKTRKVVLMWASQTGKTDSAILNPVGYFIHYEPSPIMILQPTVDMAQTISKDRLSPMLRDTPVLAERIEDKSRNGKNTILQKIFPGGHVTLQGANSPAGLASRPIRILCADEIDRYPATAGNEGDPLFLAQKRMTTFWNSKEICTSTPTIKGQSRIETEYEHSTMEEWNVPCPVCGKYQQLTWAKIIFDEEGFRNGTNRDVAHSCEHCGVVSGEQEWKALFGKGKYVPTYPRRKTRGFHVNALASGFVSWEDIVDNFLTANDEKKKGNLELLKAWTNTEMAETWDETGVSLDDKDLMERLEDYGAEVPDEVLILTCGVDTQDDRFEYEVVGWGEGKESWGIKKGAIYGDLKQEDIWQRLDEALAETFTKADGTQMTIAGTCVDSGGHFSTEVYRFCKERYSRNIWAIKGKGGSDVPYIANPSKNNRVKAPLFTLGVDTGKSLLYGRLTVEEPGPGYCHFPDGDGLGYNEAYFKGLTAEKRVTTYKKGRATTAWVLKDYGFRRNEPLDIRNYATAALEILHPVLKATGAGKRTVRKRRVVSRGIE
ncbi:MAG: phage terminase large subunit family protein [Clostridiales bacterium]|nr:phage terminase large subunit family protein [Clostridiales bacterium]